MTITNVKKQIKKEENEKLEQSLKEFFKPVEPEKPKEKIKIKGTLKNEKTNIYNNNIFK